MTAIRLREDLRVDVERYLAGATEERFGFLQSKLARTSSGPIFLPYRMHSVPDEAVTPSSSGYSVSFEVLVDIVNEARLAGDALVEFHNHSGSMPRFSSIDRAGLAEFVPYVLRRLPGMPYGATVWSGGLVYGEVFAAENGGRVIDRITSAGRSLRQLVSRDDDDASILKSFNRQVLWFGEAVQREIGRLRIGIVGAGGTGSHIAQLLAFLGIADFIIVDGDEADMTSMNRTVTARSADVGTRKGDLARREVLSINPFAAVSIVHDVLQSETALDVLKGVDVVFGCVDNDGARLVLNELAIAYMIPYFDIATGIELDGDQVVKAGGRICFVGPRGPCLACMGEIDWEEARFFLDPVDLQRDQRLRGYVTGLDAPTASVVSLNGTIANLAVNELALWCARVRSPDPFLGFDLLGRAYKDQRQRLTAREVTSKRECVECCKRGVADLAAVQRFIRS